MPDPEQPFDLLLQCTTEQQWLSVLPTLMARFGEEKVHDAATKLLSQGQLKECLKRIEAMRKRLVWMHCDATVAGRLSLAILITDVSLNEVERGEWSFSSDDLACKAASPQIVEFLATYCAQGACPIAGVSLLHLRELLRSKLPTIYSFLDHSAAIDLCDGGVERYSQLTGLPMLSGPEGRPGANGIGSVSEFEMALCRGQNPASQACRLGEHPIDRAEWAIVALGWAREHLLARPRASQYVTAGLTVMWVMMGASIAFNMLPHFHAIL